MSLPFTRDQLAEAVMAGRVTQRQHPTLPLYIYNYSPEVQYSNRWDEVTLNCRGLILDSEYSIVARPWKKFFNLGQVDLPIQFDTPVEVMDKADGSLGILYPIVHPEGLDVNWAVSTRGSFDSEQARHATAVWNERYTRLMPEPGYTMLFEIIYPANRIVLDYGGVDDLLLLGAVENTTGHYISPLAAQYMFTHRETKQPVYWGGPTVDVMPFNTLSDALAKMGRKNAEGYVIRSHNFMVKVKEPDYIDLHRLVTNASPKTVWEQLKSGKSKAEVVSAFPDEFHDYIESMIDPLLEQFDQRLWAIQTRYSEIRSEFAQPIVDRKAFALRVAREADKRYFFLMLDNRPVRDVLWAELKPKEILRLEAD